MSKRRNSDSLPEIAPSMVPIEPPHTREGALYSLVGVGSPPTAEPTLNDDEARQRESDAANREYIARAEKRQSDYLAASGTLTQFNAIMAAVHAAALSTADGPLKYPSATALLLHVSAAFMLCWAARPIDPDRNAIFRNAVVDHYIWTNDTFRNYRRGWRLTLAAVGISSLAAILLAYKAIIGSFPFDL